ncbi:alpha-L-fucosidase [Carboxylicivirga mesophila]|uniref:alpha-L-fucosidase n=1 Tax=Carboxylicivirga mesophila TaxID=1166478 RepID=A0ABS5KCJ7_9BACT|nr:alpha-L-fucosidase [Carboxylicivirga mesophila]MBS2212666.1 alpha-L-fucosidase [Carboxylicivirga mesophila]
MKKHLFIIVLIVFLCLDLVYSQQIPMPTKAQYQWHEQERIMFLHFAPTTWSEVEQNDHTVSLERVNPQMLNTDQWCEAALAFGAKEIIFVAKHSGGFCWWQTTTTEYGVRNTPYKNGKGDVLKELSVSCKKYGLNLGVYVYPGDRTWGAMIGSGGKTKDPTKQEAYNKVFRKQLTEVLSNYGPITEVWFDGSCIIDVSDILETYAKDAVVFQGPQASLRWPGTESGKLYYPAWNTVMREDLQTGVATQLHGNPNGDTWAPLETNTTLYDHYWFWSPKKVKTRKSLQELMDCYYQSVGYGSVFLLNASPDTTGLIPEGDMARYRELGHEISSRFERPIAKLEAVRGHEIVLDLKGMKRVNHIVTMEAYQYGERIREYIVEGLTPNGWKNLCEGISVGRKKIDYFEPIEISKIRWRITKSVGEPIIRSVSAYMIQDFVAPVKKSMNVYSRPKVVADWREDDIHNKTGRLSINLKDKINVPGQYMLTLVPDSKKSVNLIGAEMYYDGEKAIEQLIRMKGDEVYINQTAQITDNRDIVIQLKFKMNKPSGGLVSFKPILIH